MNTAPDVTFTAFGKVACLIGSFQWVFKEKK